MHNNVLYSLQNDIIKKTGIYSIFNFILIIFLLIDITEIQIFLDICRIILSLAAVLTLIIIYFKYKKTRTLKENLLINKNILFYLLINLVSIYKFTKNIF